MAVYDMWSSVSSVFDWSASDFQNPTLQNLTLLPPAGHLQPLTLLTLPSLTGLLPHSDGSSASVSSASASSASAASVPAAPPSCP